MSIFASQRGSRSGTVSEDLPVSNGVPIPTNKKKWSSAMPLFIALVVIGEIVFLGRLDVAKNVPMVDSWAELFYHSPSSHVLMDGVDVLNSRLDSGDRSSEMSCEEFLEKEDAVMYSRDFQKEPIIVSAADEERRSCDVGCEFEFNPSKSADAAFGRNVPAGTASVLRSMESSVYYGENNVTLARRNGYNIVMTTSLSSDVPVGYFSWAEYDIMAPMESKSEDSLAAAFISNCGAHNFRLEALEALEKLNISIDSYGACHRNHDGSTVDKVETLKRYKFSFAFENSNEEDYVTEKYFQSLVAGAIPVVIGAPNIQEFAPSSTASLLHIRELSDVQSVAKTMKYLGENPDEFNKFLRWKYEGPSDSFKALLDMAAVHSSCRLCIHLATIIHEREEKAPGFKRRPCKCSRGSEIVYHIFVRERGRYNLESIFLRSGNLTIEGLESAVLAKFNSLKHEPIWKNERPKSIRGGDVLRLYKLYPVGLTQRQALYNFRFKGDYDLRSHVEENPCAKFEVIFV